MRNLAAVFSSSYDESSDRANQNHLPAISHPPIFTRTSFMILPETFQSCTYRLPSLSQYDPCVPLKMPSIHLSCGTLKFTLVAGSGLWPSTAMIVLLLSRITTRPCRSGTET